jgi:hypothetical protein
MQCTQNVTLQYSHEVTYSEYRFSKQGSDPVFFRQIRILLYKMQNNQICFKKIENMQIGDQFFVR